MKKLILLLLLLVSGSLFAEPTLQDHIQEHHATPAQCQECRELYFLRLNECFKGSNTACQNLLEQFPKIPDSKEKEELIEALKLQIRENNIEDQKLEAEALLKKMARYEESKR